MTRSEPRTSRPGRAAPRATSSGIVSTRRCSSARSDTRSRRRGARRDSAAPVATQAPASAQPPPRRILIVDDNVEAALTLAELLALEGHETHTAYDGPSGVDMALRLSPDVAIFDLGLPGFDGLEAARRLRAEPELRGPVSYTHLTLPTIY